VIALSIRQPWAWLIVNGYKDVENRDWPTKYRGPTLIHASKTLTRADYDAALLFVEAFVAPEIARLIPDMYELQTGGLVGVADLVDCVEESRSVWFTGGQANGGGVGFVMRHGRTLPFRPWKGRLGFFNVPEPEVEVMA